MGTSLTGLTPGATYPSILKVGNNSSLSGDLKVISDGNGNDSPLKLSNSAVGVGSIANIETALNAKITSGSNLGTGTQVFAQASGTSLQFKTLIAGTGISLSSTDSEITITGGDVTVGVGDLTDVSLTSLSNEQVLIYNSTTSNWENGFLGRFDADFQIALSDGKTFGKFANGDTVPAQGKTAEEVILLAAQEALEPTVSLSSPTSIQFNQTAISNVLNFSYTINSLGASVDTVLLEWRRNNTGSYTTLSTDTAATTFTHTLTDTNFNTEPFNYRYTVTDTSGGTKTVTFNITPAAYSAPSISISAGTGTRYLGDIASTISGSVSRNSALVDISSYSIEVSVNGGAYSQIDTDTLAATGGSYSFNHNDAALVNSTQLRYRVKVTDAFTTTTSAVRTINFFHRNVLGFSTSTSVTLSQIEAFGNISLTNQKERTFTGVTAAASEYTYYVYAASDGDLNNVILDGTTPILGAFTKLTDVTGTNLNGATVTYRVYRSNAQGAFTNNSIQFS